MPNKRQAESAIGSPEFRRIFNGNLNVVSAYAQPIPGDETNYRVCVGVRSLEIENRSQSLAAEYAVPKTLSLPLDSEGKRRADDKVQITFIVVEEGDIKAFSLIVPTGPCPPGYSIGHPDITAGTFGCIVQYDSEPNHRFILSNNHVLAASNRASVGDSIIQPGTGDGGTLSNRIANLTAFTRLEFNSDNEIDTAIARVERNAPQPVAPADWITLVREDVHSVGRPVGIRSAVKDKPVVKVGRTSQKSAGVVDEPSVPLIRVNYGPGLGYISFKNQIRTGLMGLSGDSGSTLLEVDDRTGDIYVVGLLFSGSNIATYFNPIGKVLELLSTEIGGGTLSIA